VETGHRDVCSRAYLPPPANCHDTARPHQSLGNLPPAMDKPPDDVGFLGPGDVECHERLGGLLRHYERKAA
jgi:hypothetical protein